MKKLMLTVLAAAQFSGAAFAQQSPVILTAAQPELPAETDIALPVKVQNSNSTSPYRTRGKVDGPITGVLVATNAAGLYLIQKNKDAPSAEELARIDADLEAAKKEVNEFDRFAAGYFSMTAKKASDYPFYGSFALPFLLLFDDGVNQNAGQVAGLYVQTMAVTGALFTMSVAHIERKRPLIYNNDPANDQRTKKTFPEFLLCGPYRCSRQCHVLRCQNIPRFQS